MDALGRPAKMMDKLGGRLPKALALSVALHLALMMLIQPARQDRGAKVALQARIVAAPIRPVPRPSTATAGETRLSESPLAAAPIPDASGVDSRLSESPPAAAPIPNDSVPVPAPTQLAPELPHSGASAGITEPTAEAGGIDAAERQAVVSGPSTALPQIPIMSDPRWYTARQVDRRPELMTPTLPVYPEEARRQGIQGSVVIEVRIDEYGQVRDIAILEANPPGVFDTAVLEVFGRAQYSPAIRDGRPVRYIGKYRVMFELD